MTYFKEVVDRISLIAFTQKITQAMKMVSVSKLHKTQQVFLPLQEYTAQYNALLNIVLQNIDENQAHSLTKKKTGQRILLVVVTSNRGLCGAFNKNILKVAYEQISRHKQGASTVVDILVIGKKAYQFFKKLNIPIIDNYIDLLEKPYDEASTYLTAYCIEAFQNNSYAKILLIYTAFKNSAKQEVTIVPFLPFIPNKETYYSPPPTRPLYYIYEPSQKLLIQQLIPEILKHKIMHMLVESSASEHAARVATMSQATDNADELLKLLRISYNKTRQTSITNALSEITSGAEALAES